MQVPHDSQPPFRVAGARFRRDETRGRYALHVDDDSACITQQDDDAGPAPLHERAMRDGQNDRVGRAQCFPRDNLDSVFARCLFRIGAGIVNLDREAVVFELANDVDDACVAQVGDILLEREPQNRHHRAVCAGVTRTRALTVCPTTQAPMPSLTRRPARMTSGR